MIIRRVSTRLEINWGCVATTVSSITLQNALDSKIWKGATADAADEKPHPHETNNENNTSLLVFAFSPGVMPSL